MTKIHNQITSAMTDCQEIQQLEHHFPGRHQLDDSKVYD